MAVGAWLKKYGETIYGTRGGPIKPQPWGVTTQKDGRIYMHLLNWPGELIHLPELPGEIEKVYTLTGGTARVHQTERGLDLYVDQAIWDEIDTIVVLQLKGAAPTQL
jgi:alpha-L-fucosidase